MDEVERSQESIERQKERQKMLEEWHEKDKQLEEEWKKIQEKYSGEIVVSGYPLETKEIFSLDFSVNLTFWKFHFSISIGKPDEQVSYPFK